MSRNAKWKVEKTKVKVVFRLQFHATHIPQVGWDKLLISFIPADSGKATAKTTKANVRNGTCKWADPIYETTRLLQDIKSKKYDEKLYKLIVSMGSSRSSFLGDATVNLAEYADALKPSDVALPLHGCDSGAILHVTVQLLTSKTGFREFEQQRELRERGFQATSELPSPDGYSLGKTLSSEETQMDKVNARIGLKGKSFEQPTLEEDLVPNEVHVDSGLLFDASSNTSESLSAEKHDSSSMHEIESIKSTISGDLMGHNQSPRRRKGDHSDHQLMAQGTTDWVHGWGSEYCVDNDLPNVSEENDRLRVYLEVAESSINELKVEIGSLKSHADQIGAEAQKFSQQLCGEVALGRHLAKEVSALKLECSELKEELGQLQIMKSWHSSTRREANEKDRDHLLHDVRFRWLKGLLVMENQINELKNKTCYGNNEREYDLLNSDLETVLDVLQDLKQGTEETLSALSSLPAEIVNLKEIPQMSSRKSEKFTSVAEFDTELYPLVLGMNHTLSIPGLVSNESDLVDYANAMKGKVIDLLRELDESKADRVSLTKKMDQMECYYEALVQELEENQRQMLGELQSLRNEHSTCLYTVSSTKLEMETLRRDLNENMLRFGEEKHNLNSISQELERRAIAAEASLKRARLNYSIAVNRLQKDLQLLSSQVLSMFETNNNLIKQVNEDSSKPNFPIYTSITENFKLDSEEVHASNSLQGQNESSVVMKQTIAEDFLVEDLNKSLHLQEGLYRKVEEELSEMHFVNMYLDVYSKSLEESLFEASSDIIIMKERVDELAWKLDLSNESKEFLMQRLEAAMDEVYSLNEYKAACIDKCNDMALQNQILQANLQNTTHENNLHTQKIAEWESLLLDYRSYESKYENCVTEKEVLENAFTMEVLANKNLQTNISSLQEELKTTRTKYEALDTAKGNMQHTISSLQGKLFNLLSSFKKELNGLILQGVSLDHELEYDELTGVLLQLEELHRNSCEKLFQLVNDNSNLMSEREKAQVLLSASHVNLEQIKEKFENDMQNMVDKLNMSSVVIQKLQLEVESIADRLKVSYEVEETCVQKQRELSCDLDHMEAELQQLTLKNEDLAVDLLALGSVADDLGRCKLTLTEITEEKQAWVVSLLEKSEESSKLAMEVISLTECLQCVQAELETDRSLKDKLEATVRELNAQLYEKNLQLVNFDDQKSELVNLKQLVSDLESEKLRYCNLLSNYEDCLRNACQDSSSIAILESQLFESYEFAIAADVILIFTRAQYESQVDELAQKLYFSNTCFQDLKKKHTDMETAFNHCIANEAKLKEENANLLTDLRDLSYDLDDYAAENRDLKNENCMTAQFEYRTRADEVEASHSSNKIQYARGVDKLKDLSGSLSEEIDNMIISKEELEVKAIVLQAKLDEQHAKITTLERSNNDFVVLQYQCKELTQKLSEQTLKSQELEKLAINLKELNEKADAECIQAKDERESLRIAFIKEQYETKLQELMHQLSVSKKHSEELVRKLDDAIDEIENRKKSDASYLNKNEELGMKILELESELQDLISEKREKVNLYDQMKAELDCSIISMGCCKEEKQKLEASLQACIEEKSEISLALNKMKKFIESSRLVKERNEIFGKEDYTSIQSTNEALKQTSLFALTSGDGREFFDTFEQNAQTGSQNHMCLEREVSMSCQLADSGLILMNDTDHHNAAMTSHYEQDNLVSSSTNRTATLIPLNHKSFLPNDHLRAESFKSSLDHLNNELEMMKNDSLPLSQDDQHSDPNVHRELMRLSKTNEELGSMFPLFNEYSGSENPVERVLALEVEVAERLRTKKKSSIHVESYFLKEQSDEESLFQRFRDINNLIKDMLEMKGRYSAVDIELQEMHDRYSQLSLQFAEVEGERQRLIMTLKNVRPSKKTQFSDLFSSTKNS